MKLQKIKCYNKYNIQNSRIIKALKVQREKLNQTIKKAQIINKILNKILKEYNVIVQYFFYFGNKKREAREPLFFSNAAQLIQLP